MEIPTTKPEPLTLLTTLDSVKNIRQILTDQKNTYFKYDPIWVSSPYKLTDFVSFKTDVFNRTGTKDKWVRDTLEEIQKWASGNIQEYEKIKSKSFEGTGVKCYLVTNQHDLAPAFDIKTDEGINTMAYSFVWHDDNQQRQGFMLFDFVFFCKQLNDFILKYIDTEFEPKPIIRQAVTETQPKVNRAKKGNTPAKSFIDYLDTDDNEKSLEYLKAQFSGQRGQTIAYMIHSLRIINVIKSHDLANLCKSIAAEFGNIGSLSGISKCKIPDEKNNPKQYAKYKIIYSKIAINITRYTSFQL